MTVLTQIVQTIRYLYYENLVQLSTCTNLYYCSTSFKHPVLKCQNVCLIPGFFGFLGKCMFTYWIFRKTLYQLFFLVQS